MSKYVTKRRVFDLMEPWYTRIFRSIPKGVYVEVAAEAWTVRCGRFMIVRYDDEIFRVREEDLELVSR